MSTGGFRCALDLQVFAVLSTTRWRLTVKNFERIAVAGYLVLVLAVVVFAAVVFPVIRETLTSRGSRRGAAAQRLELGYIATNVYGLMGIVARETLTRRRTLPGGSGRVRFLRALDMRALDVYRAYVVMSVLPALAILGLVDVLVLAYLGPVVGLGPLSYLGLGAIPVVAVLVATAVVADNAAHRADRAQPSRTHWPRAAAVGATAVVVGFGTRLVVEASTSSASDLVQLGVWEVVVPTGVLVVEVTAAVCALVVLRACGQQLRTDPYPVRGAIVAETRPRSWAVGRAESSVPGVVRSVADATPHGQVARRLLGASFIIMCACFGGWMVTRSSPSLGQIRDGVGSIGVYASFVSALAVCELVLLAAGPEALRHQLRQLWECGAGATSLSVWSVATYLACPIMVATAVAISGALVVGPVLWTVLIIGPTVAAAGLVGQAIGRFEARDPTAGEAASDSSAIAAVVSLVLAAPALYVALRPSLPSILGGSCYSIGLIIAGVVSLRRGILSLPVGTSPLSTSRT